MSQRVLPEVGELWVYCDEGERPFLFLQRLPTPSWGDHEVGALYRALDIKYGSIREIEVGQYLQNYHKVG
jgi:hypothetical protein